MYRLFAIALLVAACSSDDGGDDSPPDGAAGGGGDVAATPPADGPAPDPPSDAADPAPGDAGDLLADRGPDTAEPDAAPLAEVGFEPGQMPPDFTLPNADGEDVSMSDFRGGYALVVGTSVW